MKTIQLTQGKVTVVDDGVYEWASKFKWYASKRERTFYAARMSSELGKRTQIYLHREIVRPSAGLEVDHKDRDGLNNLRENLREVTHLQNTRNESLRINKSSQFRGVSRCSARQLWVSQIKAKGQTIFLGRFVDEEAAARAYDAVAKEFFGEFAQPNFT